MKAPRRAEIKALDIRRTSRGASPGTASMDPPDRRAAAVPGHRPALETGRLESAADTPQNRDAGRVALVLRAGSIASHTGTVLRELAFRYEFPLRWHSGFQLPVSKVPDDFRGPAMPLLARRIVGVDGIVNAALIGTAEASLRNEPDAWRDWGSHAEA